MNAGLVFGTHDKALPNPGANKLPPPPPDDQFSSSYAPPQPPPKFNFDSEQSSSPAGLRPQFIDTSFSADSLTPGPNHALPPTPTSPASSISSADGRVKKSNPLIDLIETEKTYVDQLTGVIRKVASAWSRSNLPPPELDLMFRSLESVYKANRSLLGRLKEIGTNPSNPKALGDLLMRWIDDLEAPYNSYCERFCTGFDNWEPVQSNSRLPTMLASFSATNPLPVPAGGPAHPSAPPLWTLDELFLLPKGRIKYYKKLYGRLLKGTQPGRKDYKLLMGAAEKLDRLLATIEVRASVRVDQLSSEATLQQPEDEVVIDFRSQINGLTVPTMSVPDPGSAPGSDISSPRGSSHSSGARSSGGTGQTSIDRGPLLIPLSDLERRLSTDQCLDIFTMKPKQVRLQIFPPNLSFKREMRVAADVFIRLTPRSTGVEVTHPRGRIFILSDLFLSSERMLPEEQASSGSEADMWLLFPPLAGKFLRVADVEGQDNVLQVTILKKEKLILEFDSKQMRDRVRTEFAECIEFATAIAASSKQPVPPMPALNGLPKSPSAPLNMERSGPPSSHSVPDLHTSSPGGSSRSPPPNRASSPSGGLITNAFNGRESSHRSSGTPSRSSSGSGPVPSQSIMEGVSRLMLSPEPQMQQGAQRQPSLHDQTSGPMRPMRTSSQAQTIAAPAPVQGRPFSPGEFSNPTSYAPGQKTIPGPGPGSFGPGQVMPGGPSSLAPGQIIAPPRGASAGPMGRPFQPPPPGQARPPFNRQQSNPQGMPGNGIYAPQPPYATPAGRAPSDPSFQGGFRISPSGNMGPPNPPYASVPGRAPSDPSFQGGLRKTSSSYSLASQYDSRTFSAASAPPMPPHQPGGFSRNDSFSSLQATGPPLLPSAQMSSRSISMASGSLDDLSPPNSPTQETQPQGPIVMTVSAQMKCKIFLKQHHAQWKSLGAAKLKLYRQEPTNVKQLVVEADDKRSSVLISTIVLTDGVERVGKTGVAIELSDEGARTGIVYMIQLRNEKSAGGLFESLLAGSDRGQVL
ncbi:hypothetical protein EW146_g2567 [Bondarzewia mesenterica]|uniref:DH domain-containing protein n=1 Tax=Bondarzewia mesenterica TaxID=1095465 RepID=A0A4V3XFP7_9AGAM|nr:hypothetical protein EW146_g2567 [Bondarzewia mesenterica]